MKKRKHQKPNQRRSNQYDPTRRRKFFTNSAIVMVVLMAVSLIGAQFTRKATRSHNIHAEQSQHKSERKPASHTGLPGL